MNLQIILFYLMVYLIYFEGNSVGFLAFYSQSCIIYWSNKFSSDYNCFHQFFSNRLEIFWKISQYCLILWGNLQSLMRICIVWRKNTFPYFVTFLLFNLCSLFYFWTPLILCHILPPSVTFLGWYLWWKFTKL